LTTLESIRAYSGQSGFILSLADQLRRKGTLSDKQVAAAAKFFAPKPALPAASNLQPIIAFLRAAETNLKFPKLHFEVDGVELVLRLKGKQSAHPGAVDLVSREKVWNEKFQQDAPIWYGRIEPDGQSVFGGRVTPSIVAALNAIAADPREASIRYARKTGHCAFCGRFLETKASVSVGYGPVCADKYGLPWGEAVEVAA
jgi:hypothetical protein